MLRGVILYASRRTSMDSKKKLRARMGTEVLETVKPTRVDMTVLEDQGASN